MLYVVFNDCMCETNACFIKIISIQSSNSYDMFLNFEIIWNFTHFMYLTAQFVWNVTWVKPKTTYLYVLYWKKQQELRSLQNFCGNQQNNYWYNPFQLKWYLGRLRKLNLSWWNVIFHHLKNGRHSVLGVPKYLIKPLTFLVNPTLQH